MRTLATVLCAAFVALQASADPALVLPVIDVTREDGTLSVSGSVSGSEGIPVHGTLNVTRINNGNRMQSRQAREVILQGGDSLTIGRIEIRGVDGGVVEADLAISAGPTVVARARLELDFDALPEN